MEDIDYETQLDSQDVKLEEPAKDVFIAPSIDENAIFSGASYTHHSPIPDAIANDISAPCVLGVDEAGRGPVLGPMVYGVLYLPLPQHESILKTKYHFMDSKVLTPATRSSLMESLCTKDNDLYSNCGWATRVISARDISSGMLQPAGRGTYNLNAQAMDATIDLIKETFARGVNIQEIYIDTIGSPKVYQTKLERIFPTTKITVAKKADSLYPCVSAASVVAKTTRDAALKVCYKSYAGVDGQVAEGWGSGYPSDGKCTSWLRENMDPVFGWGSECRFSWGTAKDMLEAKGKGVKIDWPEEEDAEGMKVTDFFSASGQDGQEEGSELANWFGRPAPEAVF
ncbi:uncharacterized protein KY384_000355 [Bacidia gigantensis]|uniref:uncharacterized protein n=1 Tax=Bacidia gigantensis TaxID=2732470 RepID=UPI001D03C740|nr:uncharacterized protein KY384_000355 [Bacidia gigantensis]KAG8526362.1 hypothetical protein KY384_000355 [Bacidia gigantensis]